MREKLWVLARKYLNFERGVEKREGEDQLVALGNDVVLLSSPVCRTNLFREIWDDKLWTTLMTMAGVAAAAQPQSSGMLSREQLFYLFDRFAYLTSNPDVKKRIADAVNDKQEAVAVTTAIQEEIFLEMGVDPGFGLACLGKVNMVYDNDRDLMIRFYGFVAKEEMVCDEAELGPDEFAEKMENQQRLQNQQLEMLKHMRNFQMDDQSAILEKLHEQMQNADFDSKASVLSLQQIEEAVRSKTSAFPRPN